LLVVGLTGGIGSGKSEALAACGRLGAAVLSSDEVVHALLASEEVRDLLVSRWGEKVLRAGRVDREAVAGIVFADQDELAWLEGVLFPRVGERIAAWRADLAEADPKPAVAVIEVPLLFEAGIEDAFDATIAILAEEDARRRRLEARGQQAVTGRLARQLSQEEKASRADYVVRNDGTLEELEEAMRTVLGELEQRSQS
jgi:dephospho-CoA kinase